MENLEGKEGREEMNNMNQIPRETIEKFAFGEAVRMAEEQGTLNNSIRQGEGNLIGRLGELAFYQWNSWANWTAFDKKSYDFDFTMGERKIDIKTIACSLEPQSGFVVNLAAFNTRQKCNEYVFAHVVGEKNSDGHIEVKAPATVFLVGWMKKEDFFIIATFRQKGSKSISTLPSAENFRYSCDTYSMRYSELNPMETFQ